VRVAARIVAVPLLLVLLVACRREASSTASFVASLRCGMTREDVTRLARVHGYNSSDASWLTRSAGKTSKQLTHVDLTFRQAGLVAVRQGTYDPRTKQVAYRTIELCK
jgi:hypothetical protein